VKQAILLDIKFSDIQFALDAAAWNEVQGASPRQAEEPSRATFLAL